MPRHHGRIPGTHFLQKPFRRQDLAGKIREALDSERTTDGPE
jgi:FixJ family two-component response regulator